MALFKELYSSDLQLYKFKILSIDERIDYYIGSLLYKHKYLNKYDFVDVEELIRKKKTIRNCTWNAYYYALYKKIFKVNKHAKFNYAMEDIMWFSKTHFYKFLKNRAPYSNDGVLLQCLDYHRHWNDYYNKPKDIDFKLKKNSIIWRGVTSGTPRRKPNRFDLVKRWFNKNPLINVGFSRVTLNSNLDLDKYVLGFMEIVNMLEYKYILSIEGNDKDSGLQWKLNSNSVVIMPRPTITSWLMETTLVPDYHYVLIKDDYSDLEEKLNWCNNNQDKCIQIVKNANFFMSQFKNKIVESYIEDKVLSKYFELVN